MNTAYVVLLALVPMLSCFKLDLNVNQTPDICTITSNETKTKLTIDPRATGCQINIRELLERHPLLRNPTTKKILLPDEAGSSIISLKRGDEVELDCPGAGNIVAGEVTTGEMAIATCGSGVIFTVFNLPFDLMTVVCSRRITSVARYTGNNCFGQAKEIEIGFEFTDGHFIRELTTCFDEINRNVLYSLFDLTRQIGDQVTGGTRPSWTEGTFYNLAIRLNNLYPNAAHRPTINRQVGLPDEDTKYVKPTGHYYLAKGHFTARTDFLYYAQQDATFHYVNSAPQWQTFNGYNWFYFERNVRIYAATNQLDLVVMTGSYGISTLPHEVTGRPVELYLYADENGNKAIPVPELFWKVVYSPDTQAGVAVLGINNPYQEDVGRSVICNDIADQLTWLTFNRTRIEAGYMYACTISDLRKVIPHIPNYNARWILT